MNTRSNKKLAPLIEYAAEATTACLVTMVQGNLLALTVSHLVIASQTGVVAGVITFFAVAFARTGKRWLVAIVLGGVTAIVDFFVHPGQFGPVALEAILTGAGAAILSYLVGTAVAAIRIGRTTARADEKE